MTLWSPNVGGHVYNLWKGHVFTIQKRAPAELPGTFHFLMIACLTHMFFDTPNFQGIFCLFWGDCIFVYSPENEHGCPKWWFGHGDSFQILDIFSIYVNFLWCTCISIRLQPRNRSLQPCFVRWYVFFELVPLSVPFICHEYIMYIYIY